MSLGEGKKVFCKDRIQKASVILVDFKAVYCMSYNHLDFEMLLNFKIEMP